MSETRLQLARKLGAVTCNPATADVEASLEDTFWSSENLEQWLPDVDVMIEGTGVGAVFEQCVKLARFGSRIALVGVHKAPASLDLLAELSKELSIRGSIAYPNEFPAVIDMLCSGRVDARALISHRFPLPRFEEAFATAQRPEEAVKVMVDCQA